MKKNVSSYENAYTVSDSFMKDQGWSRHIFAASVSSRTSIKNLTVSASSAVQGSLYGITYICM